MTASRILSKQDIDRALADTCGAGTDDCAIKATPALRRAATLCPIIERPQGLSVVLTRRAANLRAHPGQIGFPGGKIEPSDNSPLDAALREAEEEIGLRAQQVEVSGVLKSTPTGTGFLVTPFIGFIDPSFTPVPNPEEVAEVFDVSLDFVMDRQNYREESYAIDGNHRQFYVIMVGDYRIWGATARMLYDLATRVAAQDQISYGGR